MLGGSPPGSSPCSAGTCSASPEASVQQAARTRGAARPPRWGRCAWTPGFLTPVAVERLRRVRRHATGAGWGPGLGRGRLRKA